MHVYDFSFHTHAFFLTYYQMGHLEEYSSEVSPCLRQAVRSLVRLAYRCLSCHLFLHQGVKLQYYLPVHQHLP